MTIFFDENHAHAPLWLATSEDVVSVQIFHILLLGPDLWKRPVLHEYLAQVRALSCRMFWCLKHSIMSSLDGE